MLMFDGIFGEPVPPEDSDTDTNTVTPTPPRFADEPPRRPETNLARGIVWADVLADIAADEAARQEGRQLRDAA